MTIPLVLFSALGCKGSSTIDTAEVVKTGETYGTAEFIDVTGSHQQFSVLNSVPVNSDGTEDLQLELIFHNFVIEGSDGLQINRGSLWEISPYDGSSSSIVDEAATASGLPFKTQEWSVTGNSFTFSGLVTYSADIPIVGDILSIECDGGLIQTPVEDVDQDALANAASSAGVNINEFTEIDQIASFECLITDKRKDPASLLNPPVELIYDFAVGDRIN